MATKAPPSAIASSSQSRRPRRPDRRAPRRAPGRRPAAASPGRSYSSGKPQRQYRLPGREDRRVDRASDDECAEEQTEGHELAEDEHPHHRVARERPSSTPHPPSPPSQSSADIRAPKSRLDPNGYRQDQLRTLLPDKPGEIDQTACAGTTSAATRRARHESAKSGNSGHERRTNRPTHRNAHHHAFRRSAQENGGAVDCGDGVGGGTIGRDRGGSLLYAIESRMFAGRSSSKDS